ncbi:MAG TPA: hypothetical protein PLH94_13570 [Fimbriimonadaceae bacterium]|nr:hypothetical protein [Fimbriimonadaceae bacterium]
MKKFLSLAVLGAALLVPAFAAGPQVNPDVKAIQDAYAKLAHAYKWRSPVAIRNLQYEYSMPDYVRLDAKGRVIATLYEVVADNPVPDKVLKVAMKATPISVSKDRIWLNSAIDIEEVFKGPKGNVWVGYRSVVKSLWVRTSGGWKVQSTQTVSESMNERPYRARR